MRCKCNKKASIRPNQGRRSFECNFTENDSCPQIQAGYLTDYEKTHLGRTIVPLLSLYCPLIVPLSSLD
jgi:hypothetical protein